MVKQPLKDKNPSLMSETEAIGKAPPDALAIVPLRNTVPFPNIVMPLAIGRAASLLAVEDAMRKKMPIGVLAQRDSREDTPHPQAAKEIRFEFLRTVDEALRLAVEPEAAVVASASEQVAM